MFKLGSWVNWVRYIQGLTRLKSVLARDCNLIWSLKCSPEVTWLLTEFSSWVAELKSPFFCLPPAVESSYFLEVAGHSLPYGCLQNVTVFFHSKSIRKSLTCFKSLVSRRTQVFFLAHLAEYGPLRIIFLFTNSKVNRYGTLNTSTESFHLCYIIWPNHESKIHCISSFFPTQEKEITYGMYTRGQES